jgi:hypothetical protein
MQRFVIVESQIIPVPDENTLLGHSGMLLQMKFTEFEESKFDILYP